MDLLDKVRLIIGNKCESPSQFADEIDIPRSAVSHLLSGRNKPSLDVVLKIIRRYPDLGTDWIWDENKMPILGADKTRSETGEKMRSERDKSLYGKPLDLFAQPQHAPQSVQQNVSAIHSPGRQSDRKVLRVVIFFADGTYEELGVGEN